MTSVGLSLFNCQDDVGPINIRLCGCIEWSFLPDTLAIPISILTHALPPCKTMCSPRTGIWDQILLAVQLFSHGSFCILGSVFCSSAEFLRTLHTDLFRLKFIAFTIMVLVFVKFRISVAFRPAGFRLIMSAKWLWVLFTCSNSMSYSSVET